MLHANIDRYLGLCTRTGIGADAARHSWELLASHYSEPHRHYHNLHHIDAMLACMDHSRQGDPAMELAVWFHDVVYDPKALDNEAQSACLFQDCLSGSLNADISADVVRLILATDHSNPRSGRLDEDLIRDIDLSILAADPATYLVYCAAIRDEYSHVPDPEFVAGRQAVLVRFLSGQIYQTDKSSACEAAARRNIQSEIARLGMVPS